MEIMINIWTLTICVSFAIYFVITSALLSSDSMIDSIKKEKDSFIRFIEALILQSVGYGVIFLLIAVLFNLIAD